MDTENIHGHIYKRSSSENRFIPYEYRSGPSTDGGKRVDSSFFSKLAEYLITLGSGEPLPKLPRGQRGGVSVEWGRPGVERHEVFC